MIFIIIFPHRDDIVVIVGNRSRAWIKPTGCVPVVVLVWFNVDFIIIFLFSMGRLPDATPIYASCQVTAVQGRVAMSLECLNFGGTDTLLTLHRRPSQPT